MKKIITLLILIAAAGAVLIGMTAASNPDQISTTKVPAVYGGIIRTQDIIID